MGLISMCIVKEVKANKKQRLSKRGGADQHFSKHESLFEHFCSTVLLKAKITTGRKNSLAFLHSFFWPILIKNYRIVKNSKSSTADLAAVRFLFCLFFSRHGDGWLRTNGYEWRNHHLPECSSHLQSSKPGRLCPAPCLGVTTIPSAGWVKKSIPAPTCKWRGLSALLSTHAVAQAWFCICVSA